MDEDSRSTAPSEVQPDGSTRENGPEGAPPQVEWGAPRVVPELQVTPAPATEPDVAPLKAAFAREAFITTPYSPAANQLLRTGSVIEEFPELRSHMQAAHTFGFAATAGHATHAGATWISPLLPESVTFPTLWLRRGRDARYMASRTRVRKLLDRLCGLDTPPPRTVVIVAHPDDEAIGVGARLRDLPDAVIVHLTDGAPRDPAYAIRKGFETREAYARSRQEELSTALSLIGIPPERTRCLDFVDGEASAHLVEITYRIADLLDELRPEVVLTHPYEGGHTDHDATAFAVHLACGLLRREGVPAPIVLELTSYHFYMGVRRVGTFLPFSGVDERTLELETHTQALKERLYDCFASQRECLAMFPRDRESFRIAPRYIFTRAPHAGALLYERVSSIFRGSQWRAGAQRALERLRSRRRAPSAAGD
jgi:N-acetylglucosamine malate deacetylase 2